MMKKMILITAVLIMSVCTSACNVSANIESTDLTDISINGLQINRELDPESLGSYTESDRYSGDYKYKFEEIIIDTDKDDKITYIFGRFDESSISVNGKSDLSYVSEATAVLGDNYSEQVYDREQHLSQHTYTDRENRISSEFIYSDFDGSLIWLVIRAD